MENPNKKNFFEKFLNGVITGLGFTAIVLIISVVYATTLNYSVPVSRVSSGSGLSATEWNKMISNFESLDAQLTNVTTQVTTLNTTNVPSGAIMYFDMTSCPSGWTEFTTARGRYIAGLPSWGTLDATIGTALSNQENRTTGQHTHTITDPGHTHGVNDPGHSHVFNNGGIGGNIMVYADGGGFNYTVGASGWMAPSIPSILTSTTGISNQSSITGISSQNSGSVPGTNAPYIQLLVCKKN